MNLLKTACITSLSFVLVLSACKKKKDETTPLFSQSVTTSAGLTIEMTWTTNGHSDGESYIDLDILLDDTTVGNVDEYEYNSSSGSGTEEVDLPNSATDGEYFMGIVFYEYESGTSSGDATYTLKIYPTGNNANPITVSGTVSGSKVANSKSYNQYKLVKSGTTYKIQEISPTLELSNGYN